MCAPYWANSNNNNNNKKTLPGNGGNCFYGKRHLWQGDTVQNVNIHIFFDDVGRIVLLMDQCTIVRTIFSRDLDPY